MTLSICTDAVYGGIETAEAVRRAAGVGYAACEFWGWQNKDMDAVIAASRQHSVAIAAFCTCDCNLVEPGLRGKFLAGLEASIAMAQRAGTTRLIATTGNDTGEPRNAQRQSIVDGLKKAAPMLEAAGVTLVLEPLNIRYDHAGYYLYSSLEGFDIIREVASPNVKLLFDIYHQQLTEGNILNHIRDHLTLIGHFHAAGVPSRHELDNGELNYPFILKTIAELGYAGYVGLEYWPLGDADEGLGKLAFSIENV